MNGKYLIFGATGSIGSSLTDKLYNEKKNCHLTFSGIGNPQSFTNTYMVSIFERTDM